MADILGGGFGYDSINSKWQIRKFISKPADRKLLNDDLLDKNDGYELNRILREIDQAASTSLQDYDRIMREMNQKRTEIKEELASMRGQIDGETVAIFHKTDLDILTTQIRILTEKAKITSDKFKSMRDEKKFYQIDKYKLLHGSAEATPNTMVVGQLNTPMSYQTGSGIMSSNSTTLQSQNAVIENSPTVLVTESVEIPQEFNKVETEEQSGGWKTTVNPTQAPVVTPNADENKVIKEDISGLNKTTLSDHQNEINNRINKRLSKKDGPIGFSEQVYLDISLPTSLKSLDGVDYRDILYINKNTGEYWCAGVTQDDNGEWNVPYSNYIEPPISIVSAGGGIDFSPLQKTAKSPSMDNEMTYVLVEDSSLMPPKYKSLWKEEINKKYSIELDLIKGL